MPCLRLFRAFICEKSCCEKCKVLKRPITPNTSLIADMRGAALPTAPTPRRPPVRLSRLAVRRSACIGCVALVVIFGWALYLARRAVISERAATAASHASALRLVRLAMELQSELDAQEDHDRWTLQLYLRLERESMPELQRDLTTAIDGCPDAARATARKALGAFGEEAHRHSQAMVSMQTNIMLRPLSIRRPLTLVTRARCSAAASAPASGRSQPQAQCRARAERARAGEGRSREIARERARR